jgi:hypothetical protein
MNSRLRKVKQNAQRIHFSKRAQARLGYELTSAEVRGLYSSIRSGVAELVAHPKERLSLYRVYINSRSMIVVYDNETEEMVTLLTEEIWQAQEMCNSPVSKDTKSLRQSLSDNADLLALREKICRASSG